jgi:hypothetical protein
VKSELSRIRWIETNFFPLFQDLSKDICIFLIRKPHKVASFILVWCSHFLFSYLQLQPLLQTPNLPTVSVILSIYRILLPPIKAPVSPPGTLSCIPPGLQANEKPVAFTVHCCRTWHLGTRRANCVCYLPCSSKGKKFKLYWNVSNSVDYKKRRGWTNYTHAIMIYNREKEI